MALDSYTDIKAWALRRAEEPTDGTSDFDSDADQALVDAWADLTTRHPWLCLEKFPPYALLLQAPITGYSLTCAAGTAVVGTLSATYASTLVGYSLVIAGKPYTARITAHAPGSALITIDVLPEALAGVVLTAIALLDYDLASDFGVFVNGFWTQENSFIALRGEEQLRRDYPDPPVAGLPRFCARIGKLKVRFSTYSEIARRVEAPYTYEPTTPSGSATIVIDRHLRTAFADLALYQLLIQKSDPSRAQIILARAEAKIERAIDYEQRLKLGIEGRMNTAAEVGPYHDSGRRRGRM